LFQAQNSECELVVAENEEQALKYLKICDVMPEIKAVVVYNDDEKRLREKYKDKAHLIYGWQEFLDIGLQNNAKLKVDLR